MMVQSLLPITESFIEGLGQVDELKSLKIHYFDDTWSDAFENYQHYEDDQFKDGNTEISICSKRRWCLSLLWS